MPRRDPPRHSQSNLSSLAMLLKSAEARESARPRPMPATTDDSGVIDILGLQERAREERASQLAATVTRTPVPVVLPLPNPDIVATMMSGQRRQKRVRMTAVASIAAILACIVVIGLVGRHASRVRAAAAQAAITALPVELPPALPAIDAPMTAPPAAASLAPIVDPVVAPLKSKKKHRKPSHSATVHTSHAASGPKMTKVASGGTPG